MKSEIYIFSLVTGYIYETTEDDIPLLFPYQIPLIKRPKNNCNKCYGRGYTSINKETGIYNPCNCINKLILPDFDTSKVRVILPRYA